MNHAAIIRERLTAWRERNAMAVPETERQRQVRLLREHAEGRQVHLRDPILRDGRPLQAIPFDFDPRGPRAA